METIKLEVKKQTVEMVEFTLPLYRKNIHPDGEIYSMAKIYSETEALDIRKSWAMIVTPDNVLQNVDHEATEEEFLEFFNKTMEGFTKLAIK